jgi:hypothetical protein
MNLERITGFASPFDGAQAPDHLTLGFATQLDLPGETKFFPFAKPNKAPFKPCPSVALDPLPTFPFGVVPTFPHQQNSDLRQRGFDGPKVMYDGSMISADLADAFAMLKDSGKRVAAPLSDAFVGSQWEYGPREGRPFGTTGGNNFVLEYHDTLREKELVRRADKLIKEGYDAKRVLRVMEEAMDSDIMEKLKRR